MVDIPDISTVVNQQELLNRVNALWTASASAARETLTAARTYYVATTGSNANDGLTVGAPFLTIQYAYDKICDTLDCAGFGVTIQIAAGTYAASVTSKKTPLNIYPYLTIKGQATITDVHFNGSSSGFGFGARTRVRLQDMQFTTVNNSITATSGAYVEAANIRFNGNGYHFVAAGPGTHISVSSGCTVNANYTHVINASDGAYVTCAAITMVGSPSASFWFANVTNHATVHFAALPTGAASGKRYDIKFGGKITFGVAYTTSSLPGDVAGTVDANGSYYGTFPP